VVLRVHFFASVLLFCLSVLAVPAFAAGSKAESDDATFTRVEWPDLMPKEDLDAIMNPPQFILDIEDGSPEDQMGSPFDESFNSSPAHDRYRQALSSQKIVPEMNGKAIQIPGFIVPNQVIFVDYPKGLKLDFLYDPFWISGTLTTSIIENDIATAAYTMKMVEFEPYRD